MWLISIPFGAGAIGLGDVKLLVGVGLLAGLVRTISGWSSARWLGGIVIVVLLAPAGSA